MKYNVSMEWRRLFEVEVIERGWKYFREGLVKDYHEDGGYVSAVVSGTHEYEVLIRIGERGEIRKTACDCPYADSGWNCKHMAAVLFEYDKRHDKEKVNLDIRIDIKNVKDEIRYLRRRYLGRYGYIEYWKAMKFAAEVLGYLDREVHILIGQGKLEDAFELSSFILETMCKTPMDDDGEIMDTMDSVGLVWYEIYEKADGEMRKTMFDWMMRKMDAGKNEFVVQVVEEFIMAEFDGKSELLKKMAYCEKMIEKYNTGEIETGGVRWVLYKVKIMKQLRLPDAEIREFYDEWSGEAGVRISLADWLVENGKYGEARDILEEIMKRSDSRYYVDICRRKLNEIYEMTGDTEARKKILLKMINESLDDDRDLYKELKGLYEKNEWDDVRGEVIRGMSRHFDKAYYYALEKMDKELFGLFREAKSLDLLKKYAKKLDEKYSESITGLYRELLEYEMLRSMGRMDYQRIVKYLKSLCEVESGERVALELVEKWRGEYKNRRALLDELGKFERWLRF